VKNARDSDRRDRGGRKIVRCGRKNDIDKLRYPEKKSRTRETGISAKRETGQKTRKQEREVRKRKRDSGKQVIRGRQAERCTDRLRKRRE